MKVDLAELKNIVSNVVSEAKKKVKKDNPSDVKEHPAQFSSAETFDYSKPLGDKNYLKHDGAANFGPYTGASNELKDDVVQCNTLKEQEEILLRTVIKGMVQEEVYKDPWKFLDEAIKQKSSMHAENIWEAAKSWYDIKRADIGKGVYDKKDVIVHTADNDDMNEEKVGFKALTSKLAKQGVQNPAGLAYTIGAKKYGKKGMAKKAAAGRKKK